MKSKIFILGLFCVLLQNCRLVDIIPHITVPTYSCLWQDLCHVQFNSVQLNLPGTDCATPFYNHIMANQYPSMSCNDLVEQLFFYQNDSIQINWTTSVVDKECLTSTDPKITRTYNLNNFYHEWQYYDYIMEAPLITAGFGVNYSDLKHELTIQIFGVTNDYDNSQGRITWTKTWIGNSAPSNYNSNNNTWDFEFPNGGLTATYTPDAGSPRHIYVHDQFEFH